MIIIRFPIELYKYRNRTAKISADITILLFKVIQLEFLPPSPKYYKYDNCWKPKLLRGSKLLPC